MRKLLYFVLIAALAIPLVLSSSASPPAQAQSDDQPLYIALVWHQHQPVYFKDPETGVYERPWVRVHATKDYVDMVTVLEDYPDIRMTVNLTPSLITQLLDLEAGAKDLYWVLSEIPATELMDDEKRFILERFFDINRGIIERFPRYQELLDMRGGGDAAQIDAALESWTDEDFRDLQVWFNLAWTDPRFLAEDPLLALVEKGEGFSEDDKVIVFAEHLRLIAEVLPVHKQYQDAGQIEVTTTPFAHPILPLLVDSDIARVGMPDAELPMRYVFGQDAVAQVDRAVELYEDIFGQAPRGMWPAEGSVSEQVLQMISNAGIEWIATDEDVLAFSLPEFDGFTRNGDGTVQQPDALYRPYTVTGGRGGQVNIIFRDHVISDLLGFEYSGLDGQAAADDLLERLNNIQVELAENGAEGPNLVTILLDGENAWEFYENDGIAFFEALYQGLSDADNLQTVTPSEYIDLTGDPEPLDYLFPGSWITPDFSIWIGEDEENLGWTYLLQMRQDVQRQLRNLDDETATEVMNLVHIAEGSDWFWWYGTDQNSGNDADFDRQFRQYLEQIYLTMGMDVPSYVYVPIIPDAVQAATREGGGLLNVVADGEASDDEWADATYYDFGDQALYYGFDESNVYVRMDGVTDGTYDVFLRTPDRGTAIAFARDGETLIGFGANRLLEITVDGEAATATLYLVEDGDWLATEAPFMVGAVTDGVLELSAALADFSPAARSGNPINMRVVTSDGVFPSDGTALAVVPDLGVPNIALQVSDPSGDDYGAGTYIYPTNPVFTAGSYDATEFVVGSDEENIIFQVTMRGPLNNEWGSPNGMGILTVDIYVDVDGADNGSRILLPGRNAAITTDNAWDYAIFAEGWEPAIYQASEEGAVVVSESALNIISNPGQRRVTIQVPRSILDGDPAEWAYAVTIASQEGFPSGGVLRIRDVQENVEEYRLGGSQGGTNATRVIDIVNPEEGVQEESLSYTPSDADIDDLSADDFPQVPMFGVGG